MWIAVLAGFLTGILSGMGLGGGTLLLIVMTTFLHIGQSEAGGINLLYFLPCATVAVVKHKKEGFIDRAALIPALIAGLICAGVSAALVGKVEEHTLRRLFGGLVLLVGLSELKHK